MVGSSKQASKQANIHTRVQWSPASVGLAQARPNYSSRPNFSLDSRSNHICTKQPTIATSFICKKNELICCYYLYTVAWYYMIELWQKHICYRYSTAVSAVWHIHPTVSSVHWELFGPPMNRGNGPLLVAQMILSLQQTFCLKSVFTFSIFVLSQTFLSKQKEA